jgi:hypothetical protein
MMYFPGMSSFVARDARGAALAMNGAAAAARESMRVKNCIAKIGQGGRKTNETALHAIAYTSFLLLYLSCTAIPESHEAKEITVFE